MKVRKKVETFNPEWNQLRAIAVKSLAIWALRDDGLSEKEAVRHILRCGYLRCEAAWAVKEAAEWLATPKPTVPALDAKRLKKLFSTNDVLPA